MSSPVDEGKDWTRQIIEEFRSDCGKVGGNFAGAPLLLLHAIGARSGLARTNPMMYQDLNGVPSLSSPQRAADPPIPICSTT